MIYRQACTFPVKRSQRRPSGKGSPPLTAVGSTFWHSGIERPLKRIPWIEKKWLLVNECCDSLLHFDVHKYVNVETRLLHPTTKMMSDVHPAIQVGQAQNQPQ